MPAAREDLQWVALSDFTPGIVDPLYSTGNPAFGPLGSARNAVGCLPSPTGGLRPGWRLMEIRGETNDYNNWGPTYRPPDFPRSWTVATGILTPVESHTQTPSTAFTTLRAPDIPAGQTTINVLDATKFNVGDTCRLKDIIGMQSETALLTAKTATTMTFSAPLANGYRGVATNITTTIWGAPASEVQFDSPDVLGILVEDFLANNDSKYMPVSTLIIYDNSQLGHYRTIDARTGTVYVTGTDWRKVGGAIAVGMSGTVTSGVTPSTVWASKTEELRNFISAVCFVDAANQQLDHTWPNPLTSDYPLGTFGQGYHLSWRAFTYHDNRTIGIPRRPVASQYVVVNTGSKQASYKGNMNLEFTGPGQGVGPLRNMYANYPTTPLLSVTDGSGTLLLDLQANPVTQLVSINGQTLMAICNNVGGYMARGSIEKPQFVKLAGLPPSRGRVSVPVVTPAGVVYGTRDGVFAVGEDGSSQELAPNLAPEFWVPTDAAVNFNRLDAMGKFNYLHPYVLAPNGYVLDTESSSWWKLPQHAVTAPFSSYEVSSVGHVYAFPQWRSQTQETVWLRFDPNRRQTGDTFSPGYTWQSNGIKELTPDARAIDVRGLEITGSGFGTVRVAVLAGGVMVTQKSFVFTSAVPATMRTYMHVSNKIAAGLSATTIDITVEGDGTANPLPNVDEIKVGTSRGASAVATP